MLCVVILGDVSPSGASDAPTPRSFSQSEEIKSGQEDETKTDATITTKGSDKAVAPVESTVPNTTATLTAATVPAAVPEVGY